MIIQENEKVHVIYRAIFDQSIRRHFVGQIEAVEGSICRINGYVFIYDTKATKFVRKNRKRITIINTAESGYIVNVIKPEVDLELVEYRYITGEGDVVTDGKGFQMNINEFGSRS